MSNLSRLYKIASTFRAYGLDSFLSSKGLKAAGLLKYATPLTRSKVKDLDESSVGKRLKLAFEELGPIWVKLGQVLSIQGDIVSPEIALELKNLQEKVSPFSDAEALAVIKSKLPQAEEYLTLGKRIGAASMSQVYQGVLNLDRYREVAQQVTSSQESAKVNLESAFKFFIPEDADTAKGEVEVVIKVLRPQVAQQVEDELQLIRRLFRVVSRYKDQADRLRGLEVVEELENNFRIELNLEAEANNARLMRSQWLNSKVLYIPEVFGASTEVMIMERIYGQSINDSEALATPNLNRKLLAQRGVEIFFKQFLEYNFFHADMHPGNIFLDLSDPSQPSYMAVDFGIVGSLKERDKKYLVSNLIAFFTQDYHHIAQVHINSGWVRGNVDEKEFERRIAENLGPLFNKHLEDFSFALVLERLFQVAREFKMVIQPQLILLQKTLVYVEAMGRKVYPQLNLWETAKPIVEDWFKKEYSIFNQGKKFGKELPQLLNTLSFLPNDIYRFLENDKLIIRKLEKLEEEQQGRMSALFRAVLLVIVLLALLIVMYMTSLGFPFVAIAFAFGLMIVVLMLCSKFFL